MKVIVGLGNPGKQYEKTRHNVGFMVLDELAKMYQIKFSNKHQFQAAVAEVMINNQKVLLVKPLTYMNLSGLTVNKIMSFYNINYNDLLVISDDVALALGSIRLRSNGGHGGHNGLRDILAQSANKEFKRLRIGIDENNNMPLEHYVLAPFSKGEEPIIKQVISRAVSAVDHWVNTCNFELVMNQYNTKV